VIRSAKGRIYSLPLTQRDGKLSSFTWNEFYGALGALNPVDDLDVTVTLRTDFFAQMPCHSGCDGDIVNHDFVIVYIASQRW
jgi:hypothetical protein